MNMSSLPRFVVLSLSGLLSLALAQPAPDASIATAATVGKKGIGFATGKTNRDVWSARVSALNVSWHYSWGPVLPGTEPDGVEFVPMLWTYHSGNPKPRAILKELAVAPNTAAAPLLGLNEPDGKDQADMTVEQALAVWPELMATGRRLGSPATVNAQKEWLQDFMRQAQARGYRVDFVCVHWYGGPNADSLVKYLKKVHELYGKPIWITEFGVGDWKAPSRAENKHSPKTVLRFMREVLPKLDALDFVERYAWFPSDENDRALGPSALFQKDGTLTPLGECYAAHRPAQD